MLETLDTASIGLLHGLFVLFGLIFCFLGHRLFRLGLSFVYGFAFASVGAYLGLEHSGDPVIWSWLGLFIGAVLGGLFSWFLYNLTVAVSGGVAAGTFLYPALYELEETVRLAITAVASAAAGLFAIYLANLAVILVSSVAGSILIVLGGQYFRGGSYLAFSTADNEEWVLYFEENPWILALVVLLALLGFWTQWRSRPGKPKED